MTAAVASSQRFTRRHACPVCGGGADLPAGRGVRCYGFLSADGRYAHCTREELAGGLRPDSGGTYSHRLDGPCACGAAHGAEARPLNGRHHEPSPAVMRCRRWEIRDPAGTVVAVHVRRDFADGSKRLHWEQPDGTTGLRGQPVADLPLYGIDEVGDAAGVIVVEGEPACDALEPLARECGLAVVGTITGAGGSKRPSDDVLRTLPAGPLYLWPDADDPGTAHMTVIADALRSLGRPASDVRLLTWPGARPGEGDDAADFMSQEGTPEVLRQLIETAPAWAPVSDSVTANSDNGNANSDHETEFLRDKTEKQKQQPRKTRLLAFRGADEIGADSGTEARMIAPYLFAERITEFDGAIKTSGKTTFVTHLCRAIIDGEDFLGTPTQQSPVVFLTEQSRSSFTESLRRAGLLGRAELRCLFYGEAVGVPWPQIVRQAREEAARVGAKVVMVDTLSQWAGLKGDSENWAGAALEAMAPLQAAVSEDKLSIAASRHDGKRGGPVGHSARGSTAFGGAVDVICRLRRPDDAARPTLRIVEAIARFDGVPDLITIELTEDGYTLVGDADASADSGQEARFAVAKHIPRDPAQAATEAEIVQRSGVSRSSVRRVIEEFRTLRFVNVSGSGAKGSPHRYWFLGSVPDTGQQASSIGDAAWSESAETRITTPKNADHGTSPRDGQHRTQSWSEPNTTWSETLSDLPTNCSTPAQCRRASGCPVFRATGRCNMSGVER